MPSKVETKPVSADAAADEATKRAKPSRPTYIEMIIAAIKSLSDKKGKHKIFLNFKILLVNIIGSNKKLNRLKSSGHFQIHSCHLLAGRQNGASVWQSSH